MATKFTPKKNKVTGTKKKDTIKWQNKKPWKVNLTVDAAAANDTIDFTKSSKNNTFIGGKGNDTIKVGSGKDTVVINKGDGNDTIYHKGKKTTIKFNKPNAKDKFTAFEKKGNDLIATYTHVKAKKEKKAITEKLTLKNYYKTNGAIANDTLYITNKKTAKLSSLIKNLKISAVKGVFSGTSKADTITGTNSNDTIYGNAGNDKITAGNGNDLIDGGAGNDTIFGTSGNNILKGGAGDDSIVGGSGNDSIYAGAGTDIINAGLGSNTIYFTKSDGTNVIQSGGGNDKLIFTNAEAMSEITAAWDETNENDLIINSGDTSITLVDYKSGTHSAKAISYGNGSVSKDIKKIAPKIIINNSDEDVDIEGTDLEDSITYNGTNARIFAKDGDDVINSFGTDTIYGGEGDDIINFTAQVIPGVFNKEVYIAPNEGNDSIQGVASTLQTNLNFDSSATFWADKNEEGDLLLKTLAYKDGQYYEQETSISNYYNSNGTLNTYVSGKLKVNGDILDVSTLKNPYYMTEADENTHTSTETEFIYGTSGNDTITASDGNDTIYGNGGNDVIEASIGHDVLYLGSGNTTVKADMSMMVDGAPETYGYVENFKKTIYMQDDSVLTIDLAEDLFENYCGVFCRGSGIDNDLYISLDGGTSWCFRIKDYFDENNNPKTNSVYLKIWEYPDSYATERVQQTYTVPEWADGSYWGRQFEVQPFGPYEGPIYGTNMASEWLMYSGGMGDDTIYGGNGNSEEIYINGGNDEIHLYEGTKNIYFSGNQSNSEIYLGSNENTKTTFRFSNISGISFNIDGNGDLNASFTKYNSETDTTYNSTATVKNWNTKTSKAYVNITGNDNDNSLTAFDGAETTISGEKGNDTLIGGTGNDTFYFDFSNGYGTDIIRNATSADNITFSSTHTLWPITYSNFKYYRNNENNLVIETVNSTSSDISPLNQDYLIIEDYFTASDKVDRVIGDQFGNITEHSLASVDYTGIGKYEEANGASISGTNTNDVLIGKSGENTITGGQGADELYSKGGTNTFEFNAGDGSDILYQTGGSAILKFNNATITELTNPLKYDRDKDDLILNYDNSYNLRVVGYYGENNVVTQIIDSTGTTYNMSDYIKNIVSQTSYISKKGRAYHGTDGEDIIRASENKPIYGNGGSDIIYGSNSGNYICSYGVDNNKKSAYRYNPGCC